MGVEPVKPDLVRGVGLACWRKLGARRRVAGRSAAGWLRVGGGVGSRRLLPEFQLLFCSPKNGRGGHGLAVMADRLSAPHPPPAARDPQPRLRPGRWAIG